jgi:hypothetical protein
MKTSRFVRYELIRTFRNRRFFVFTVGFPLVLYFLIAAPNRHEHDLAGSGISAPPYFMVGLAARNDERRRRRRCADRVRARHRVDAAASSDAASSACAACRRPRRAPDLVHH